MADVKLTPEWCEGQSELWRQEAIDAQEDGWELDARDAELRELAYALAARALRAREWAEAQRVSLSSREHRDNYMAGQECAVLDVLAILDGREP